MWGNLTNRLNLPVTEVIVRVALSMLPLSRAMKSQIASRSSLACGARRIRIIDRRGWRFHAV